jgi:hypothetical protein
MTGPRPPGAKSVASLGDISIDLRSPPGRNHVSEIRVVGGLGRPPDNPTKTKPAIVLTPTSGLVCSNPSPIKSASFLNVTNPVLFQSTF